MSDPAQFLSPPLSLKGLLDGALGQLRRHVRTLYLPFALPLAVVGGAAAIVQMRLTYPAGGGQTSPIGQIAGSLAVGAVTGLFYSFVYTAMIIAAVEVLAGSPPSPLRAWRRVLSPRLLGTQILAWIAILGGLALCILPGVYVGLLLSLLVPVMVREACFGPRALRRSYVLATHNPRRELSVDPRARSFLLSCAGMLIGVAISFLPGVVNAVVMFILMFRAAAQGSQADPETVMRDVAWIQAPSNMLGMLVQALVFLYMAFGLALLYADVVKRKEGADLLAAAERLAQGTRNGA